MDQIRGGEEGQSLGAGKGVNICICTEIKTHCQDHEDVRRHYGSGVGPDAGSQAHSTT